MSEVILTDKEKNQKGILEGIDELRKQLSELKLCMVKENENIDRKYRKDKERLQENRDVAKDTVIEEYTPFMKVCREGISMLEDELRGEVDE